MTDLERALAGEKNLTDYVVNFVRTGVIKILSLEINLALISLRESRSKI
jgi:hypothetical protein